MTNYRLLIHTNLGAMAVPISKESSDQIYMQVYHRLRKQIVDGFLQPKQKISSSRDLAVELGVSRTSVISGLEQLKAEGYIESKQGSGCCVSPVGKLHGLKNAAQIYPSSKSPPTWGEYKPPIQAGTIDMRLFPYKQWSRCVAKVARETPQALIDVSDSFGDRPLRESIARYLFEWRGINVSPKQILITAGSIDALEISIGSVLKEGDSIGLENPGYLALRNLSTKMGLEPVWMPIDESGANLSKLSALTHPPKLLAITPSHQFPLGGAMTPDRRNDFLNWAQRTNSWIIEDDYDSEFRYAGKPIPALTGLDHYNNVIYVGSFSKMFSTGLRLGYLVAPENLVPKLEHALSEFSSKAAVSMQRPLAKFMDSGEFYRHLRRLRRIYAERRLTLINALESELGDMISFKNHQAGIQFTATLSNQLDDAAIAHAAQAKNIHVVPLSRYYAGEEKQSGLIISYCHYQHEEIIENIKTLKNIIAQFAV